MALSQEFRFGASTAAHQVEGGTSNDWSRWELENATRLARRGNFDLGQGKLPPETYERFRHEIEDPDNYISGRAADHYRRYREDMELAASLGLDSYRFSVEWSRIEPEPGRYDDEAIDHYRKMAFAARWRGLEPFVTLWHFTLPRWAEDLGGWTSREVVDAFVRFARVMAVELGDEVRFWATLNEPETYAMMVHAPLIVPTEGRWLDYPRGLKAFHRARRNMVRAHGAAYRAMHRARRGLQVGITLNHTFYDGWGDPLSRLVRGAMKGVSNNYFTPRIAPYADWIGLQYYFHCRVKVLPFRNEFRRRSDMGWELYPEGHYHLLQELARFRKPIYITESGLADADDTRRQRYLCATLIWVARAVEEGADCRGFFCWSLLDNFEWDKGFWPRFGLVEVDRVTLERRVRPSARSYTALIAKIRAGEVA